MTVNQYRILEDRTGWCNTCGGRRNQHIRHAVRKWSAPDEQPAWEKLYEVLDCMGCNGISFRIRSCNSEDIGEVSPGELDFLITEQYFPPRVSRPEPRWLGELEWFIHTIMKEVYTALYNDLTNLAAMGARTVIDLVMTGTVGSGGFAERLKKMVDEKIITEPQSKILNAALDLGNAANHRAHYVSAKQLTTAMDIIENLLQTLYVLPTEAAKLQKVIPPRI